MFIIHYHWRVQFFRNIWPLSFTVHSVFQGYLGRGVIDLCAQVIYSYILVNVFQDTQCDNFWFSYLYCLSILSSLSLELPGVLYQLLKYQPEFVCITNSSRFFVIEDILQG